MSIRELKNYIRLLDGDESDTPRQLLLSGWLGDVQQEIRDLENKVKSLEDTLALYQPFIDAYEDSILSQLEPTNDGILSQCNSDQHNPIEIKHDTQTQSISSHNDQGTSTDSPLNRDL